MHDLRQLRFHFHYSGADQNLWSVYKGQEEEEEKAEGKFENQIGPCHRQVKESLPIII